MSNQPHRFPQSALAFAVNLARKTTARNAERYCKISRRTILKEMRRQGVKPRRAGSPTLKELDTMGRLLVE